ncbi:MAG: DUF72 domain-containing protein [Phycisphaerales bacterium]
MTEQMSLFGEDPAAAAKPLVVAAPIPPDLVALAARLPPRLRLGTSSWTYPGWTGVYAAPGGTPVTRHALAYDGLAIFAAHPLLRTVSIDRAFHGPIPAATYARYAALVPDAFRFTIKVHRDVTSPSNIDGTPNPRFLDAAHARETIAVATDALRDKAGMIVLQFPPLRLAGLGGASGFIDRLERFLAALRSPGPAAATPLVAVEVRNAEILRPPHVDRHAAALRRTGAIHCYNLHPGVPELAEQCAAIPPASQRDILVRWMLRRNHRYEEAAEAYRPFDRLVEPDEPSRAAVADLIHVAAALGRDTWVIANNKAEGSSVPTLIELAREVVRRLG